ncbi:MAG: sulfurtransferase [Pseudomonadota bacterium]
MAVFDTLMPASELMQRLDDPHVVIVDCRFSLADPDQGRRDYSQGHIPGAVYAHLDADLASTVTADSGRHPLPQPDEFVATVRRWGVSSESQVVVYDDAGGGIAARAWWLLQWMGHEAAALLDGGFAAWIADSLPVSAKVESRSPGTFSGAPASVMSIDVEEVQARLASDENFLLVDARDSARFRGEQEPIDPVAGHVPGARNLPFNRSLTTNGRFLSPDELRRLWEPLKPGQAGEWAVMCGSGVTACHLALSAQIAGLPAPRLYVGSWSEWLREPVRGVGTGDP